MVNIFEILKNAPVGITLYSPICGVSCFVKADDRFPNMVIVNGEDGKDYKFYSDGRFVEGVGECMLFPAEGVRNWDDWQVELFRKGDVVKDENGNTILCGEKFMCYLYNGIATYYLMKGCTYANYKEKIQFFNELYNNGFKWNDREQRLETVSKTYYGVEKLSNVDETDTQQEESACVENKKETPVVLEPLDLSISDIMFNRNACVLKMADKINEICKYLLNNGKK